MTIREIENILIGNELPFCASYDFDPNSEEGFILIGIELRPED